MYAAYAAFILRKPHISFEDTGNWEQIRLYLPFTSAVLTSTCFPPLFGKKQVSYYGYHELAYLHPNRFMPDKSVLSELGVEDGEPYVILRFVSLKASHDFGQKGISQRNRMEAVMQFSKYAKVFISSESELAPDLEKYRFTLAPHRMHHAIAFAALLYGESATMASEAAMLGVPSIFLNNKRFHTISEQETKYGLLFTFSMNLSDQEKSISKGVELINLRERRKLWGQKRDQMLSEKIDVTAFLVWFVENYPTSKKTLNEHPDFQNLFK